MGCELCWFGLLALDPKTLPGATCSSVDCLWLWCSLLDWFVVICWAKCGCVGFCVVCNWGLFWWIRKGSDLYSFILSQLSWRWFRSFNFLFFWYVIFSFRGSTCFPCPLTCLSWIMLVPIQSSCFSTYHDQSLKKKSTIFIIDLCKNSGKNIQENLICSAYPTEYGNFTATLNLIPGFI